MNPKTHRYGIFFLLLTQTMVGLNIVSAKILLSSIPILVILTIRFSLASLILLPLHWFTLDATKPIKAHFSNLSRKDFYFILAQALSAGVLFNCLMLLGLNYTDANVAGIITSALPSIIALMSWLALGERISAKKGLCIGLATLGLMVISYEKFAQVGPGHHSFLGDALVLLSLIPEAVYYVLSKRHPNKQPIFLISALLNGVNAIILLPSLFLVPWDPASIVWTHWFILLILGLTSGLFYVFWFLGCQRVDGVMASLSTAVMPIATVLLAWPILHEHLSTLQAIGMGLVIFSIIACARV